MLWTSIRRLRANYNPYRTEILCDKYLGLIYKIVIPRTVLRGPRFVHDVVIAFLGRDLISSITGEQ